MSRMRAQLAPVPEKPSGEDDDVEAAPKLLQSQAQQTQLVQKPQAQSADAAAAKKTGGRPVGERGNSRLKVLLMEQNWFSVYKRLWLLSITLNVIGLVLATTGHFPYAKSRAAVFSVANILASVLVRNEVFLRVLFWLSVKLLGGHRSWIPIGFKFAVTAFLQSLGGIHSGCGVSSVMWLIYAIQQSLHHHHFTTNAIIGTAFGVLALLLASIVAAFPALRHIHHNLFERIHRFAGWLSVALVWLFIFLADNYNPATGSYSISGHHLVSKQEFWFLFVTTIMIIMPWICVRKVPVHMVVPSKGVSLINFEGGIKPGILARISPSPLSEWHAFGIISDGKERHTIVAGAVGDFTKELVENPPTHLWVRTFHFAGLPYLVNMYDRALLVATGSGISVYLSFLLQPTDAQVHLIWIAKAIRKNYGDEFADLVNSCSADKVTVYDSAISGRPNAQEMAAKKAKEFRADVVIVTSNPGGTRAIISTCKAAGIPAYGPIWDS
ncbi:hypothetical protein O6H91_03G102900 [Diphasiastrum complanatum]|uniref:Uncharacterized protein n=2 Tax=Diphasiastrum complanatum TaxID=34168 RepID=A0ACC2EA87_DIPCM|nr:hypothetical protein O6H91_03G102800 [Diphasiastrum complanatum]KAJ7563255.1 hypothetical protein O6H91_03G102900 [Diphasiastrum complanatum]